MPHGVVTRARIVSLAAEGHNNQVIAEQVSLSRQMVCKWRQRYIEQGPPGLHDELRPGRPRSITDEEVTNVNHRTLKTKPTDATHWSIRSLAKETELTRPTIHRIWKVFGLQPHRQKSFKLSTDPFFVEKVRDIVGLYLNPPDKAMILCAMKRVRFKLSTAHNRYFVTTIPLTYKAVLLILPSLCSIK